MYTGNLYRALDHINPESHRTVSPLACKMLTTLTGYSTRHDLPHHDKIHQTNIALIFFCNINIKFTLHLTNPTDKKRKIMKLLKATWSICKLMLARRLSYTSTIIL